MGWDWVFGLMTYCPEWRQHRKLFHRYFDANVVESYRAIQLLEARKLLKAILRDSEDLEGPIRQYVLPARVDWSS